MKPIEPGCIAIVIVGKYAGTKVDVTEKAPKGEFTLPNGIRAVNQHDDEWVIELPFAVPCEYDNGEMRMVTMGCARQRCLMRIDDYDASTEETTSDKEVTV